MSVLDQVITASEAAALLGVTTRQVQRLCKAGKLDNRYADGVYLITRESVTRYMAGGPDQSGPDTDAPTLQRVAGRVSIYHSM